MALPNGTHAIESEIIRLILLRDDHKTTRLRLLSEADELERQMVEIDNQLDALVNRHKTKPWMQANEFTNRWLSRGSAGT